MGVYRLKSKIMLVITTLLVAGIVSGGVYYYYSKHKEPTNGIFVYEQNTKEGDLDCGYIHQPT